MLLAAGPPARATGPSWAEARVVPVAVSAKGVVLFKTWRELNPEGARAAQPAEVGWLVVSGDGLWLEIRHEVVVEVEVEHDQARYYRLRKEFQAAFDWRNPPKSVRPLLARYELSEKDRVAPDVGKGAVTWSPQRLCLGSRCAEGIFQWAPGGIVSEEGRGTLIASTFFAAGVAVFHREPKTEDGWETDEPPGASFRLPPIRRWDPSFGWVDVGYDMQLIDGVVVLPDALRERAAPGGGRSSGRWRPRGHSRRAESRSSLRAPPAFRGSPRSLGAGSADGRET
jgi:hypothetical protein